ncbi:MAG: tetratricopeptide repeat protein [Bacteroidia bacterium]
MLKKSLIILMAGVALTSCKGGAKKETNENIVSDSLIAKYNSPELKRVNDLLKASPSNQDLYLQRGKIYMKLSDFDAAIGDGVRALKLDSSKDAPYLFLTDAYFYSNKTRQSKDILERCVKNIPTSTEGFLKLAELFFYVKKYQESINAVNNALKINENLAKGYFLKGMCYKESGDSATALSSFQTAAEQDNQYYDANVEAGMLLAAKKNFLAIEYFNNALKIDPKSTEVMYLIGKFYQDLGKLKEAVDAYNKLLAVDKKDKNALYNLGAIEFAKGKDSEKAKEYFTEAINSDPQYAEAYFARGACFEDLKSFDEAIADYKLALQYKPNYEPAVKNLNSLLERKKGK